MLELGTTLRNVRIDFICFLWNLECGFRIKAKFGFELLSVIGFECCKRMVKVGDILLNAARTHESRGFRAFLDVCCQIQ